MLIVHLVGVGLPPIIARNMMMKSKSDTVYLPLVARIVQTANSAVSASTSEGADFLIISSESGHIASVFENIGIQHVKVPVFFSMVDSHGGDLPMTLVLKLLESGALGIVMSMNKLKLFGDEILKKILPTTSVADRILPDRNLNSKSAEIGTVTGVLIEKKGVAGFARLDVKRMQLIESESLLLKEVVGVIQEAAPTVIFFMLNCW